MLLASAVDERETTRVYWRAFKFFSVPQISPPPPSIFNYYQLCTGKMLFYVNFHLIMFLLWNLRTKISVRGKISVKFLLGTR